jgi:hypothetical protein
MPPCSEVTVVHDYGHGSVYVARGSTSFASNMSQGKPRRRES